MKIVKICNLILIILLIISGCRQIDDTNVKNKLEEKTINVTNKENSLNVIKEEDKVETTIEENKSDVSIQKQDKSPSNSEPVEKQTSTNSKSSDHENNQIDDERISEEDFNKDTPNIEDHSARNEEPIIDITYKEGWEDNISVTVELIKENTFYENKYYSPDKKNYIRVVYYYDTIIQENLRELYLNDTDTLITETTYNLAKSDVKWIDNKNVLIVGEFILNIETNKKIYIAPLFDDSLQESFATVRSFDLNEDNTKIAYYILEFLSEETDNPDRLRHEAHLYIYDIKKNNLEYKVTVDILGASEFVLRLPGYIRWNHQKPESIYLEYFGNIHQYNLSTSELTELYDANYYARKNHDSSFTPDKNYWLFVNANFIEIHDTRCHEKTSVDDIHNNRFAVITVDLYKYKHKRFSYIDYVDGYFYVFAQERIDSTEYPTSNRKIERGDIYKIQIVNTN